MQRPSVTSEEVEAALCEIDQKYGSSYSDTKEASSPKNSLPQLTKKLCEEFDCLGISDLDHNASTDKQLQLVVNALKLVNLHRKAVAQLKEQNVAMATLKANNVRLEKKLDSCQQEIAQRDSRVHAVNRQLILARLESDNLRDDKQRLQQEFEGVRKACSAKAKEWEHRANKLQYENQSLKDGIGKNAGTFRSKDDVVAELIRKYKMNEEVYNDTIRQLQENNQGLIAEILNLKEEVLIALYDKTK